MKLFFNRTIPSSFLLMLAIVLASHSYGVEASISLVCPCNVERVNQTKAVAKFSVVFDKEVSESGAFFANVARRDTIGTKTRTTIAAATVSSLPYSSVPQSLEISLPFYSFSAKDDQFLSLTLFYSDDTPIIDMVALNEEPLDLVGISGVDYSSDNQMVFDGPVTFGYDSSSFSFSVSEVTNIDLRSVSDVVKIQLGVADASGSFYPKSEVETTIDYNAQGKGSLSVSGALSTAMDSHLTSSSSHTDIQIRILREDDFLLRYQVGALEGGNMPTFAFNVNNIDTLLDSDRDGISDFNERLIGTSPSDPSSIGPTPIEVVFTYGTSAQNEEGDGLQARLGFIIAVANTVLNDAGVNVVIQNVGAYEVGDDESYPADYVMAAFQKLNTRGERSGIFSDIDNRIDRKPDIFIHLSSGDTLQIGGKASLLGKKTHGILDYENYFSKGLNSGTVAIDNPSLTLMHELGHLMGLTHARRQDDASIGTFRWSLGHGVDNDFATVMAYASEFGSASWVNLLSSPDRTCGSSKLPCGIERGDYLSGADSVLSLKTTMHQISAISNGFPPSISLEGEEMVNLWIGTPFSEPGFVAIDKEDGILTSSVSVSGVVDTETAGTYTVTYSVTDSDQNIITAIRGVIVAPDSVTDVDGDGVKDSSDAFPLDSSETLDTDNDGIGNNTDTDDDNDGYTDVEEIADGTDPLDANSAPMGGLSLILIKAFLDKQKEEQ
ncbi:DUF5011 domain-containing protein [Porticoccaceae bacterium]|nr:DUF5011 domain-containing protein [Porticoccaceae bacterium]MDB9843346.1 DUF5011 domain-containing protein [Porticoccaceae bacterium]MDC0134157.1 DUF5011 domain-containing protein [Porticoccaceae bacterium]MDC1477043.1 DUF5011 domain-containing protein [Porticoccaceae bacterium]